MNYFEALEYLASLSKFGSKPGLSRITKLLESLNNPEKEYQTIHVGGTNGKGSTAAMIASILNTADIKVGLYTSPHLVSYRERIVINGQEISEEEFGKTIALIKEHVDKIVAEGCEHPTEFEILTAAAFHFFAAVGIEYAIIEVGLGGTYDSTNVIRPIVSVITNVTNDHLDKCGPTIKELADHKAGIIKWRVPVITSAKGEAMNIIFKVADDIGAPLYTLDRDFFIQWKGYENNHQIVTVRTNKFGNLVNIKLPLLGAHQLENCAMAATVTEIIATEEERLSNKNIIKKGIENTLWPGRLEFVKHTPDVILDGAHNEAGARALRASLDEMYQKKPINFIFGMLKDKDIKAVAEILVQPLDKVYIVCPKNERSASLNEIKGALKACNEVRSFEDLTEAYDAIRSQLSSQDDVICITGSLYLVGEAKEKLFN